MTADTSYQDSLPFLLAGNAGTIAVSGISGGSVTLAIRQYTRKSTRRYSGTVVTYKDNYSSEVTLLADSGGTLTLKVGDILHSLSSLLKGIGPPRYTQYGIGTQAMSITETDFVEMKLTDSETTLTLIDKQVFMGKVPQTFLDGIYAGTELITVRPQIYRTDPDGVESLILLCPAGTVVLKARLWFDVATAQEISFYDTSSSLSQISVGYSEMRAAADDAGYSSQRLLAYDIWAETTVHEEDSDTDIVTSSSILRYITDDRASLEAFLFRSSLGTLERIYTVRDGKAEAASEVTRFSNSERETELFNEFTLKRESFSGYVGTAEELRYWQEFFASAERYVELDGTQYGIVVDDIDGESADRELNSVSFTWHFADRLEELSRTPRRQELTNFR